MYLDFGALTLNAWERERECRKTDWATVKRNWIVVRPLNNHLRQRPNNEQKPTQSFRMIDQKEHLGSKMKGNPPNYVRGTETHPMDT